MTRIHALEIIGRNPSRIRGTGYFIGMIVQIGPPESKRAFCENVMVAGSH